MSLELVRLRTVSKVRKGRFVIMQAVIDGTKHMIDPDLKDLWTPTGLLLGFQITLFKWRLERETEVGDKGDIPWLVPSDYMSIVGMVAFTVGVVLLPVSNLVSVDFARYAFGLGTLVFLGQALGLAGHYQLFNRTKLREFVWFPTQEKIVVTCTAVVAAIYTFESFLHRAHH